jgi:hypothetical protein
LFLRPRRFGKSLLISMLERYYDMAQADAFERLFRGLAIFENPSAERNSYLVLRLDFAGVTSDRSEDELRRSFTWQLRDSLTAFFAGYRLLVPELAAEWGASRLDEKDPVDLFAHYLQIVRRAPWPVYLFIDEHDSFANDLIARGRNSTYHKILGASGFVRDFYKRIKTGADNGIIRRIFITGVSPLMVNDMTSGFNIAQSISQEDDFHDLCGFHEADVARLLDGVMAGRGLRLDRRQVLDDLRRYYNGYQFSPGAPARLYNPDMVLAFMSKVSPPDRYPAQLLDMNVRTDYSRLHRLIFDDQDRPRPGPFRQIQTLLGEGAIRAPLHDLFRLEEVYDERFFASYLFYLGLLTLDRPSESLWLMRVPNTVIEMTYGEALNLILRSAGQVEVEEAALGDAVSAMAFRGTVAPFADLLFGQVIRQLSNRDLIRMDEKALKVLMLGYLGLTDVFYPFTEMEMGRGYGDLVLVLNRKYTDARFSYLVELKYLKETVEAGPVPAPRGKGRPPAKARRPAHKSAARLSKEVEKSFLEAEAQLLRYQADPRLQGLAGPGGWKAVTLVQVGTEALYHREPGQPTQRAAALSDAQDSSR